MNIRNAEPGDYSAIYEIHQRAFSASELGHNGEADLVSALHADGDAVCSLVAEVDGAIIGHVLFSRMSVEADGQPIRAAGLAPVSVLPVVQRSGVGTALINAGLEKLKADGFHVSFVVGHADYYPRFGYRTELAAPYDSPFAGPHFMAMHLDSAFTLPQRGKAEYAPAFSAMG